MNRTASTIACLGAATVLLGVAGPAGCGGGTLGGNGGDAPLTGAGGGTSNGPGIGGGRPNPGSAGDTGGGAGGSGGDGAPRPDGGGTAGQSGSAGAGGRVSGRGGSVGSGGTMGSLGIGGSGGVGGNGGVGGVGGTMASCPPTMSPVCGSACGNGMVDSCLRIVGRDCHLANVTEDCDGMDFGPRTCQSLGYGSGSLVCSADCTLDWTGCSECVPLDSFVAACRDAPAALAAVSSFRLAATDSEVGVALVDNEGAGQVSALAFARLSPALELEDALILDDTSQPGPLYGASIYQAAVAPIPSGWVVAACSDLGVYLHTIDAGGRDVGRTVVAHVTDPNLGCQPETLLLAARPDGGPLLVWQTADGVNAALIADDGLSAGPPQLVVGSDVLVFGADAAWVGSTFTVAAAVETLQAGDFFRVATIQSDGSVSPAADVVVGAFGGPPRIATGAGDLRVVYPGAPLSPPDELGVLWQRLDVSGGLAVPPVIVAALPAYFGIAPAVAFGDDTFVLVDGYGREELAVVRVGPTGQAIALRDIVKAPALPIGIYDMVRRGPELVVAWLSPSTGGIGLARVTSGEPEAQ